MQKSLYKENNYYICSEQKTQKPFKMKKYLVSLTLAVFAIMNVACQKDMPVAEATAPSQYEEDGIEVIIKSGAPFQTKADGADYITVTCIKMLNEATLVSESVSLPNGLVQSKQYTEEGEHIATLIIAGDKIVDVELGDYVNAPETRAQEKFRDCVKRVYKELKDNLDENNEILCDMGVTSTVCELVAEASAIVKCL